MTPAQAQDRESVWKHISQQFPEFTHKHDVADNYHAVREIVLGGSLGWKRAHALFHPFFGAKVMDVGANAGIYSAFCALRGALVTAYEPYTPAFSLLKEMIIRSNLSGQIDARNLALWTSTGQYPFLGKPSLLDGCNAFNGTLNTKGAPRIDFSAAELVPCISFEEAIGSQVWDCVKLDVEGAEFELILKTPEEALQRIRFMFIELHPWASTLLYEKTIEKLKDIFHFEGGCPNSFGRWEAAYLSTKERSL